jgi:transposase-like protein
MAESKGSGERRRVFSAEVKLEAVRRMEERRAGGANLTQIGRELGVRPDQLRKWKRQRLLRRRRPGDGPAAGARGRRRAATRACPGGASQEPRAPRGAARA